ncbi:LmrCD-specific DARPin-like protein, partial [Dinothrombium tinctorium]
MSFKSSSIFDVIGTRDKSKLKQQLKYGNFNLNEVDARGYSPILLAANQSNLSLIELLIKHGAAFNDKTRPENVHCDPLHIAAKRGDYNMVELLVKKGANINAFDSIGNTPMFYAILYGHSEVCRFLLRNGARSRINYFENASTIIVESISISLCSECLAFEEFTVKIPREGEKLKYILFQKLIELPNQSNSTNFNEVLRCLFDGIHLCGEDEQMQSTSTYALTMRKCDNGYELITKHGDNVEKHMSRQFRFVLGALGSLKLLLDFNFLVDVSLFLDECNPLTLKDHSENRKIEIACYKHHPEDKREMDGQYNKEFIDFYNWLKLKLCGPSVQ